MKLLRQYKPRPQEVYNLYLDYESPQKPHPLRNERLMKWNDYIMHRTHVFTARSTVSMWDSLALDQPLGIEFLPVLALKRQPGSGKNSHGVTYGVASEKVLALRGLIEEDSMKGKHYVLLCYYCSCLYLCYSCKKEYETLTVSASHSYEINVHSDCSLIVFKDIFKTNHVGVLLLCLFFLRALFFFLQETLCCV